MGGDLEDFEALLDSTFSAIQFSNDLLKATNGDPSAPELDIGTSIKKINYDIGEIDMRIEETIRSNSNEIVSEIFRTKDLKNSTADSLRPSFEYLDMSYKRLQEEVLNPYEKAHKLQSVLSKLHQTSTLLRDSLVYVHLIGRLQSLLEEDSASSVEKTLQLASAHVQMNLNMTQNPNLLSLGLIKRLETEVASPNRREILNSLSITLSNECINDAKVINDKEKIIKIMKSLFNLSKQDFVSTMHKIILSNIAGAVQSLTKTLNSIQKFPVAFEDVVKKGIMIYHLENMMKGERASDTTLLSEFMSQMRPRPLLPCQIFWTRVATNFKKDFDMSIMRGGPVGKSLTRNQDLIMSSIRYNMSSHSEINDYLDTMIKSVSILKNDDI